MDEERSTCFPRKPNSLAPLDFSRPIYITLINSASIAAEVAEENYDGNGDFEFAVADNGDPPITADELLSGGQILPIYLVPASPAAAAEDTDVGVLLRQLLINGDERTARSGSISSSSEAVEEEYCSWSPEWPRKSASTGSERRSWRMRDLLYGRRSRSDGKDKFRYLEKKSPNFVPNPNPNTMVELNKGKKKLKELDMVTAPRLYYGKDAVGGRKRSFLPYRQELIGFSRTNYSF